MAITADQLKKELKAFDRLVNASIPKQKSLDEFLLMSNMSRIPEKDNSDKLP